MPPQKPTLVNSTLERRDVPVIAFGGGITLLGVIRTFHRAGIPVYAVTSESDVTRSSRCFRRPPVPYPANGSREEFEAFLEVLPFDHAVLIGCSDDWASCIASLSPRLTERFHTSTCGVETMNDFVDKLRFAKVAKAAGIPIPFTQAIDSWHCPVREVFRERDSLFIKPRDSVAFVRDYGVKAFWARSPEELAEGLRRAGAKGHRMVLQEYVPGPPDSHYLIDGFVNADGDVVVKLARQRLRMYPADFGNSTYMISVALDEVPDASEALDRLFSHVRYRGIFSAEFKRDERDGRCRMLELNPRPWWYVEFAARCGVDVCSMAYDDALGRPVQATHGYQVGRALAYPRLDWLACKGLLRSRKMRLSHYVRSVCAADHPLHAWSDPLPGIVESVRFARGYLSRRLGQGFRSQPIT